MNIYANFYSNPSGVSKLAEVLILVLFQKNRGGVLKKAYTKPCTAGTKTKLVPDQKMHKNVKYNLDEMVALY